MTNPTDFGVALSSSPVALGGNKKEARGGIPPHRHSKLLPNLRVPLPDFRKEHKSDRQALAAALTVWKHHRRLPLTLFQIIMARQIPLEQWQRWLDASCEDGALHQVYAASSRPDAPISETSSSRRHPSKQHFERLSLEFTIRCAKSF